MNYTHNFQDMAYKETEKISLWQYLHSKYLVSTVVTDGLVL